MFYKYKLLILKIKLNDLINKDTQQTEEMNDTYLIPVKPKVNSSWVSSQFSFLSHTASILYILAVFPVEG